MSASRASRQDSDGVLTSDVEGSVFWRLKLYLQFSGWLLYIINATVALLFLLLAGSVWLVGGVSSLFWVFFVLGSLSLTILVFDLSTVKLGLRPTEPLPGRLDELDPFELMRARHSCRSFQARDLTPEHRAELLEAVRQYSQPGQLLGDRPIRFEYVAAPLTVWPTVGGREFLVAIAPKEYNRLAVIDVGRSLQKVVLQATRMGLGTCWIGPGADQKSVAAHLGERFDPDRDHIICVCAVGYESWFKPVSLRAMHHLLNRRLPLSSLFFADPSFAAPLETTTPPFADYGRCYEDCQWAPSSYNTQTTRVAAVAEAVDNQPRPVRFDFYAATGSRYYAAVALGIWCANWELGCEALELHGHFAVLSEEARGVSGSPASPRYDISWVVAPDDEQS